VLGPGDRPSLTAVCWIFVGFHGPLTLAQKVQIPRRYVGAQCNVVQPFELSPEELSSPPRVAVRGTVGFSAQLLIEPVEDGFEDEFEALLGVA
jgi:hypothetical protein